MPFRVVVAIGSAVVDFALVLLWPLIVVFLNRGSGAIVHFISTAALLFEAYIKLIEKNYKIPLERTSKC